MSSDPIHWDHREQPPWDEINAALTPYGVKIEPEETWADEFAVRVVAAGWPDSAQLLEMAREECGKTRHTASADIFVSGFVAGFLSPKTGHAPNTQPTDR